MICRIPRVLHTAPENCVPRSVLIVPGTPKRTTQCEVKLSAHASAVMSVRGTASSHLVVQSCTVTLLLLHCWHSTPKSHIRSTARPDKSAGDEPLAGSDARMGEVVDGLKDVPPLKNWNQGPQNTSRSVTPQLLSAYCHLLNLKRTAISQGDGLLAVMLGRC